MAKKILVRGKDAFILVELGVGVSGCNCNTSDLIVARKYYLAILTTLSRPVGVSVFV